MAERAVNLIFFSEVWSCLRVLRSDKRNECGETEAGKQGKSHSPMEGQFVSSILVGVTEKERSRRITLEKIWMRLRIMSRKLPKFSFRMH